MEEATCGAVFSDHEPPVLMPRAVGSLFAFITTRLFRHNWTMIVTVTAMFMMQLTMMEIIDMICMRNPLVPAINMIASALHRRT